jgi:hypothetical protein
MIQASMAYLRRLIETPKVGESAEGCCIIWVCVECHSIHHGSVIEQCIECGEKAYPYVQGDTYANLAKEFLSVVKERDDYHDLLLRRTVGESLAKAFRPAGPPLDDNGKVILLPPEDDSEDTP